MRRATEVAEQAADVYPVPDGVTDADTTFSMAGASIENLQLFGVDFDEFMLNEEQLELRFLARSFVRHLDNLGA